MRKPDYSVLIEPLSEDDGGGFLATVPDLPGCMSDGDTREAAARNIEDAIACWLEEAQALGRDIPQPKPALRTAGAKSVTLPAGASSPRASARRNAPVFAQTPRLANRAVRRQERPLARRTLPEVGQKDIGTPRP